MDHRGSTFAFVTGLTAGIINLLLGLNVLFGMLIISAYLAMESLIGIGLVFFAVTAVNFAGGCACRSNRIAGGIMMLVTALPMLIVGVACMFVPLVPADMFQTIYGTEFVWVSSRATVAVGLLLMLLGIASGAAGIVSLAARPKPEPEASSPQDEPNIGEQPFAQRYAAYMKRDDQSI